MSHSTQLGFLWGTMTGVGIALILVLVMLPDPPSSDIVADVRCVLENEVHTYEASRRSFHSGFYTIWDTDGVTHRVPTTNCIITERN